MSPQPAPAEGYTSSNLRKHTSPNPLQRLLLDRFHETAAGLLDLAAPAPRRILDAGCGEGFAMRAVLAHTPAAVIGLDGSAGAVRVAAGLNPGHAFAAGDLYALPFPDRSFDVVVCMEVLEHLEEPARGLRELCRVSARWLLLSVPDEPLFRGANFLRGKNVAAWGNDPGHVNHWSAAGFLRFVGVYAAVVASRTSFPWTIALCRV
ncbi:MAG TPA: methyltransferase domain-containing protein [Chloroflexaceae bacterium]|nr:methyltransferase domain-containing protein [Chloroflexaceae bacterium]